MSEQERGRTCQNCGAEYEPPEDWIDICRKCRIKEIRDERRDFP